MRVVDVLFLIASQTAEDERLLSYEREDRDRASTFLSSSHQGTGSLGGSTPRTDVSYDSTRPSSILDAADGHVRAADERGLVVGGRRRGCTDEGQESSEEEEGELHEETGLYAVDRDTGGLGRGMKPGESESIMRSYSPFFS
jgi:hypothetical protein